MRILKKLIACLAACCMFLGVVAFTASCGGGNGDGSSSSNEITITIVCKDESGSPISGVDVSVTYGVKIVENLETNANGIAVYVVKENEMEKNYTILVSDFPVNCAPQENYWRGKVEKSEVITFIGEDLTPDGSQKKPFPYVGGDAGVMSVTIPANTSYHYDVNKLAGRYFYYENAGIQIIFNNETYGAAEGEVEVPIGEGVAESSPSTVKLFEIKNTTSQEITFNLSLKKPKVVVENGTESAPYTIVLGQTNNSSVTVSGVNASVVYYKWTATQDGTFNIASSSEHKSIMVSVQTGSGDTSVTLTNGTDVSVDVTAGQMVIVSVTVVDGLENGTYSVVHTATFA